MVTQASIFIVEDELLVAEDIRDTLRNMGYSVLGISKSGEEALEKIKEARPDIVLMDIQLAGKMDGIETAGQIHTLFNIPVIYLTAYADDKLLERAKVTEPYGYVLKPYSDREIYSVIEMALYKYLMVERVKERDRTIQLLFNSTPDAMLLLDNYGNILGVNETMVKYLNRKPEDLLHVTINDLLSTGGITVRLAQEERNARSGKAAHFIEEVNNRWLEHGLYPVFDAKGNVEKIAIYIHDITSLKAAERELVQLNAQLVSKNEELLMFTASLDGMDDSVLITDHTGSVHYINQAAEKMLGFARDEVVGRHISEFKAPESRFAIEKEAFLMDPKGVWLGSFVIKNRFGLKIATSLRSTPIMKGGQRINRVFVLREQH